MSKALMLSELDENKIFDYLSNTRHPERNKLIFSLSIKAGLRVGEIAQLTWRMMIDISHNVNKDIAIPKGITKGGKGERLIPIGDFLKNSIECYLKTQSRVNLDTVAILNERWLPFTPNSLEIMMRLHYKVSGLSGCSSHSGRRTFITKVSRVISLVGGSLQDVRIMAGHRWITTTQKYIDGNTEAQSKVVNMI